MIINGMIVNSGLDREAQQRQWLEALLAENQGRRVFMFSHYPPYLSRPYATNTKGVRQRSLATLQMLKAGRGEEIFTRQLGSRFVQVTVEKRA